MAESNNPGQWTPGTFRGVIKVTLQLAPGTKGGAVGPTVTTVYINGGRSFGPAALFSLQLSYVIFMPFVERPALRGHRWQRQAEDNKGGCQLALQDLAVASVQRPQSVRGETIPGLPAGL